MNIQQQLLQSTPISPTWRNTINMENNNKRLEPFSRNRHQGACVVYSFNFKFGPTVGSAHYLSNGTIRSLMRQNKSKEKILFVYIFRCVHHHPHWRRHHPHSGSSVSRHLNNSLLPFVIGFLVLAILRGPRSIIIIRIRWWFQSYCPNGCCVTLLCARHTLIYFHKGGWPLDLNRCGREAGLISPAIDQYRTWKNTSLFHRQPPGSERKACCCWGWIVDIPRVSILNTFLL